MTNLTREEQLQFMKNAMDTMMEDFEKNIKNGKIPEDWDGVELRWYIRDKASEFVWSDMRNKKSKRYKDYDNIILVNNL